MSDGIYIDSRGAEMEPMSFTEALGLVHNLAEQNLIDENDIAFGDAGLASEREWQLEALSTVSSLLEGHGDEIDEMTPTLQAEVWDEEILRADRGMDATQPINAIRIVLASGEQNALRAEQAIAPELADEIDRQQQAFDVVRDLIGMHAAQIDRIVVPSAKP